MSVAPAVVADHRPSPYRFFIETVLFLGYLIFGLSWIGYAPFLADFQQRFALNHAQVSLLISVVSFSKIFMPFAAGWLGVRLGVRRALTLGLLLACASLATPWATSFAAAVASRFVFGLGGAVVVTLIGSAVLQWFPRDELPIVNGFNYVAVNSGIALSLFITLPLASHFGERSTLLAYAGASCGIALLWLLAGRDGTTEAPAAATANESYLSVLRVRETWLLALGFAGPLALYLAFNTWLPTFYGEALHLSRAEGARLTGLFNLAGIPAAILGGLIARSVRRRKPLIYVPATVMSLAALGLFLLHNQAALFACSIVFGAALFLWISPLTTLAMELPGMTPPRFGMTMGVFYSVSYIAAFFAPIATGALRDRTGSFLPGFLLCALLSWSLVVSGALLPETGQVKTASPQTR